jgi:hypothetical protein
MQGTAVAGEPGYNPHPTTRHFLAIPNFSKAELIAVFGLAARMKRGDFKEKPLAGKTRSSPGAKTAREYARPPGLRAASA